MADLFADAVVVGGGHHGLVAAAVLADAGWDVVLLEAEDEVGGAVRSTTGPDGFVVDRFSAFYPLGAGSPVLQGLELQQHGLRWSTAPAVVAHPSGASDDVGAVLRPDPADTAAALERDHAGDGDSWMRPVQQWQRVRAPPAARRR